MWLWCGINKDKDVKYLFQNITSSYRLSIGNMCILMCHFIKAWQNFRKARYLQGWCGILIFDKYTYLASFWYLSLYKYPKYTYEHPKYTYYQNILMKRVSVQKYPKGGPLGIKCKLFINISFYLRRSYRTIECQLGILECWKGKKSPDIPHLLWSLRQTEYPKSTD